jgi:hypothetical protein
MGENEDLLRAYEQELALAQAQNINPQYATSMFPNQNKQNLVEWQLDFKPELEAIERLLKCDIIQKDKDGNDYWAPNPDQTKVFINETGVNDVLRQIILFLNKNKVLSNYNIDEINKRVKMIKNELRVLIYNNYESYGMDNDYKWNNYSFVVHAIGNMIEDAYRRALNGEEHKGLNEQRLVTQNEPLMPYGGNYAHQMGMGGGGGNRQKKFHWYAPWSWSG